MEESTKAIVINSIKYADADLIVTCYTEVRGITTYMVRGVLKSKRGKLKKSYFQPLTQLKLVGRHNVKGNLHTIKDAEIGYFYEQIHVNIVKQSIAIFIAEVLYHSIKEEEKNTSLYHFLETSFQWLDTHTKVANFHIIFLMNLTKYLGFYPDISKKETLYFDLLQGKYVYHKTPHTITDKKMSLFKMLLGTNFDAFQQIDFSVVQRQSLLQMVITYYELHVDSFRQPKSIAVLEMLFK